MPPSSWGSRTPSPGTAGVGSLAEAAAARGVEPGAVVKTIVVRLADDDYRFVLVPGDREIAWPKLRALLGVNRLSMPSADVAFEATGYVRGTITPLGSRHAWPVVADATLSGPGLARRRRPRRRADGGRRGRGAGAGRDRGGRHRAALRGALSVRSRRPR